MSHLNLPSFRSKLLLLVLSLWALIKCHYLSSMCIPIFLLKGNNEISFGDFSRLNSPDCHSFSSL